MVPSQKQQTRASESTAGSLHFEQFFLATASVGYVVCPNNTSPAYHFAATGGSSEAGSHVVLENKNTNDTNNRIIINRTYGSKNRSNTSFPANHRAAAGGTSDTDSHTLRE